MSIFRKATEETKQLSIGDEGDFLVVRADISKREFNALAAKMPTGGGENISIAQAADFTAVLFDTLVLAWSGGEGKPSGEDYLNLTAGVATLIDAALSEHFASLLPDSAEGK